MRNVIKLFLRMEQIMHFKDKIFIVISQRSVLAAKFERNQFGKKVVDYRTIVGNSESCIQKQQKKRERIMIVKAWNQPNVCLVMFIGINKINDLSTSRFFFG